MARVLGIHEVGLVAGTDPAEFEKAAAEMLAQPELEGWRTRVLRGQRGPRTDQYLVVFEIDSVEARDRYFPHEGSESSDETDRFEQEHPEASAAWQRFFGMTVHEGTATDYVDVAG